MTETPLAVFKGRQIRRTLHNNEWWFSIIDVCWALTESADAGAYWRKLKQRLKEEGSEVVTFCHGLKLPAPDGRLRETDCANTEGMKKLKTDAQEGGSIAGNARKALEKRLKKPIVSAHNYLKEKESQKKIK